MFFATLIFFIQHQPSSQHRSLIGQGAPGMTLDPETIPPVPVPTNIVYGEFKQTEKGQYILPLFDELLKA